MADLSWIHARPRRRIPIGVGVSIAAAVSIAAWMLLAAAAYLLVRAL